MGRPWYAFYPADYEQDTAHLTLVQHGAYRRLLDHYYSTAKPLPANAGVLHRVCRAFDDAEKAAVNHIMATYFKLEADGYHSHRVDRELLKACEISEKRKEAANSRYAKAPANAVQKHTQLQPQSQIDSKKEKATPSAQPFVVPDFIPNMAWEDFLEMRKKQRKPATEKAKALLARSLEKLMIEGHDPGACLEQSTTNCWTDVYPLKEKGTSNGRTRKQSPHELAFDVARDYCAEILASGSSSQGSGADQAAVPLLPARSNGSPNSGGN